jgi:(1->4)-alpha-D-glucan 1-alpha-D-glucosylmutase
VVSERDRRVGLKAISEARRRNPTMDAAAFAFVRDVMLLKQPPDLDEQGQIERDLFIGRFQQVTSPVMAKGVEDTAFYRYLPLVSANDVGAEPEAAVTTVDEYHRQNATRFKRWPHSIVDSTTHDTKRTEDVRARINVLSETPALWRSAVQRWSKLNRRWLSEVDDKSIPSRRDEWLFYQTLVGVWPINPPNDAQRAELVARLQAYMEKAGREAKIHTSWLSPDAAYEEGVREFIAHSLSPAGSRFVDDLQQFHETIIDAGLFSAASQVLLKFTAPGVAGLYQGQEIWDFSLVDPDNRRPVDYERRRWLLAEVLAATETAKGRLELAKQLASAPRDDRLKLFTTMTALAFRGSWPDLLDTADYIPLEVGGQRATHVCAFAWRERRSANGDETHAAPRLAIVAAPRLLWRLSNHSGQKTPCGPAVWGDTHVVLPNATKETLVDRFTGHTLAARAELPLAELLADFPLGLWCNESRD